MTHEERLTKETINIKSHVENIRTVSGCVFWLNVKNKDLRWRILLTVMHNNIFVEYEIEPVISTKIAQT